MRQMPCLLGFDKTLGVVCSTRPNRQCPNLFTTATLWVWRISDLMPSFPRSAQRAPSNCHYFRVLDRKRAWPVLTTTWHCDIVTTGVRVANDPGAFAHQKTKAKHLSNAPLQAKGLIPSPPVIQPHTFLTYADFTRIFASKHADFWHPTRRGFWNVTTRNLTRNFGRGFFGAFRPMIFSISGPKKSTPKISAQISCFFTAIFWPILPAKSGAGTEQNEGPT